MPAGSSRHERIIACHDELVVEFSEGPAEEVARFVEEVMVTGMHEVVNPGLDANDPERIPVKVDVEITESWGGESLERMKEAHAMKCKDES